MTALAEHQRVLRDLLKGRPVPDLVDPYLVQVAGSDGLVLLREIAVWWRMLFVEGSCTSLVRLLKKRALFEPSVHAFYRAVNVSPYAEEEVEQFLSWLQHHSDPLVVAMARFELALRRVRQGDTRDYVVDWDRNPDDVFQALASGRDLPPSEPDCTYRLHVSAALPGHLRCERLM